MKQKLTDEQLNEVNGGVSRFDGKFELYRETILDAENPGHGYYIIHYSNDTTEKVLF